MTRPRVVIVGSGNVGSHLSRALARVASVTQVWSRSAANARALASLVPGAAPVSDLSLIDPDTDFCIVAVADNAIPAVAAALPPLRGIVAHTSGTIGIDALSAVSAPGTGVFYPLQTFSRARDIDISRVPFFIEGSDSAASRALASLASLVSSDVRFADSASRAVLHLAAVFACNFANSLWVDAEEILRTAGYDLSVFSPLLFETLAKALADGPLASQTGPARRRDSQVIDSHLAKLTGLPHDIYQLITTHIIQQQHPLSDEQN